VLNVFLTRYVPTVPAGKKKGGSKHFHQWIWYRAYKQRHADYPGSNYQVGRYGQSIRYECGFRRTPINCETNPHHDRAYLAYARDGERKLGCPGLSLTFDVYRDLQKYCKGSPKHRRCVRSSI
jgi:hypothetical protein